MKKLLILIILGLVLAPDAHAWYNAGGWNTGVGMGWGRHGIRPYVSTGYNFAPRRERVETIYVPVETQYVDPYYHDGGWQYEPAYQEEPAQYEDDDCCDPLYHHSEIRGNNEPKPHQPASR